MPDASYVAAPGSSVSMADVIDALTALTEGSIDAAQSSSFHVAITINGIAISGIVTGTGFTYEVSGPDTTLTGGTIEHISIDVNGVHQGDMETSFDASELAAAIEADELGDVSAVEQYLMSFNWSYRGTGAGETAPAGTTVGDGILFNLTGDDDLRLGGGNDTIFAGDGNDRLVGGGGNDILDGGSGADVFIGLSGNDVFIGGGAEGDTADYSQDASSGAVQGIRANLHGTSSFGGLAADTVVDSFGDTDSVSDVPNITATQFVDLVHGGAHGNRIALGGGDDVAYGHQGNDNLIGQQGNDILTGDEGRDTLNGGEGIDTADYSQESGASGISVLLSADRATDSFGDADALVSIENVYGTIFDDSVSGDEAVNLLLGFGGNDTLYGLAGNDRLFGHNGADILSGGTDNDTVSGGDGTDQVFGGSGVDTLNGDSGDDVVSGGGDNDTAFGGIGDDDVFGGGGNDSINGDAGADVLSGGGGDDVTRGGSENDTVFGGAGNDSMFGDGGNDTVSGGTGNDIVRGGDGNDQLLGGAGIDTLDGGAGTDALSGGSEGDFFVFGLAYDDDTVSGFQDDLDTIRLDDSLWGGGMTVAQVLATYATQTSPGIVDFDFGNGDTLRIVQGAGISVAALENDIVII